MNFHFINNTIYDACDVTPGKLEKYACPRCLSTPGKLE
jgi:hypothetical protein